ncbi:uncharacterized protein [Venturia canescens]|nr:uncharacterized protein LOC122417306 isoform X2 [Venturia canescens]XP_043286665.1 uncharacterized protein LOC122417306 isoform X2 [Venturia canescens]XP_043286666.1 uncharacterized protein LOC122417306 isoform X2 [Venturia canescens]
MEDKKSHRSRRHRERRQNVDPELQSQGNIRCQIARLSAVSGLNVEAQEFTKKEKEKDEPQWERNVIRRVKNLGLYEDDFPKDYKRRSVLLEKYAGDHEIIADIRISNGGVSYSNKRLERLWTGNDSNSLESSMSSDCDKSKSESSSVNSEEEKYKKNVLVSSLLKQRRVQKKNERKLEKPAENGHFKHESQDDVSHILRDPLDPDFTYRRPTVENSEADYTVEHVGKINVVSARKYLIENFDDSDLTFCQQNPCHSVSSRAKDNES